MTLLREDVAPALDREVDWAVSGWAGLELAAPFTTTTPSLQIYVADTGFAGPLSNVSSRPCRFCMSCDTTMCSSSCWVAWCPSCSCATTI